MNWQHFLWELSAALSGAASLYLALDTRKKIRERNRETEATWHAKPEALAAQHLTLDGARQARRLPNATAIQTAVKLQKAGLLSDKKLMFVVSDFNLNEVLGILKLGTHALAELSYKDLAGRINADIAREFDAGFCIQEKMHEQHDPRP